MTDRSTGSLRELALTAFGRRGAAALMLAALLSATQPLTAQEAATPTAPTGAQNEVTQGRTSPVDGIGAGETSQPGTSALQQDAPAAGATEPAAAEAAGAAPAGERDETLPHDLSPWGMFMAADWVVKSVMIGLVFASLITWTVWAAKSMEIAGAKMRLRTALRAIYEAGSLGDALQRAGARGGTGAALVRAAAEEVHLSERALDHVSADGLKERVASRLSRIQAQAGRRLMRGTGVLATIGSTAPFVGLFGTVWGIMNSFIGISEAQTTNLAVVAPGIAEALLATALGLVAAIPAVMIYNVFARSITGYKQALGDAVAGIERLVSRDVDFRGLEAPQTRPDALHLSRGRQAMAAAAE